MRRALLLANLLVTSTAMARPSPLQSGDRYVALGSSYAAGPGLGTVEDGAPQRCGHGAASYSRVLARTLSLNLVDASCSGSTTEHILEPWNEIPPQIDAVTANTKLVTITSGGNDVAFVTNLGAAACATMPVGTRPTQCPTRHTVSEADWQGVEARLHKIAQEVRRRAPEAKLVFVDYVTVVGRKAGCASLPGSADELAASKATAQRLAALTAKVARREHAVLIRASKLTADHAPCDAQPWSAGLTPPPADQGVPLHPGPLAHGAIARTIAATLSPGN
ncbi:SGNH/GDSL hydrolase family protein [Novosphingobium olei]|uniref:SGNH/GDSL hydrolase family protein n=1 Tax=Novosphingobium olei TaxID=2728851 RepID=UPI003089B032|nr:SGNH/GDSL hydrolase family protein [Novosphingobium olei]